MSGEREMGNDDMQQKSSGLTDVAVNGCCALTLRPPEWPPSATISITDSSLIKSNFKVKNTKHFQLSQLWGFFFLGKTTIFFFFLHFMSINQETITCRYSSILVVTLLGLTNLFKKLSTWPFVLHFTHMPTCIPEHHQHVNTCRQNSAPRTAIYDALLQRAHVIEYP